MKKTLAMLLAVIMVVGLFAACGNTEDKKTETETTEATPEITEAATEATIGEIEDVRHDRIRFAEAQARD